MHEYSVVEQLVKIVAVHAAERRATAVRRVDIVVGELTGYMEESLRFYFEALTRDSTLAGAELAVRYITPKLRCNACGTLFERRRFSFDCPSCGGQGTMTDIGSEFYIDTVEMELPDDQTPQSADNP